MHLLKISSAGRNDEPVWKFNDTSQVNVIAGELDEKYYFVRKDWRLRNQERWYALSIVAPLEVDYVIVKTLSQKDMPPIDVLKLVPSESWPKAVMRWQ